MTKPDTTDTALTDKLRAYVREHVAPGHAELTDDDSLIDLGLLDSLKMVNLTEFIGSELGVEVDDDDLEPDNFESIAVIAAFVAGKRKG